MDCPDLIGQVLDGKYRMNRELGRGGMGAVYLATHLGTERPVAVKVIAPQYMQRAEFIERFRREARAAGRLRHPNVVNVTDFGFSDSSDGPVAYLVMEYLDGCTLGEILEEEGKLPVGWTLDILEQVSSAVQEAHEQGIIHRDLKPDNIWLEPNQRGGYTVKVLDFGIAKLEEQIKDAATGGSDYLGGLPTLGAAAQRTFADAGDATIADSAAHTHVPDAAAKAAAGGTQLSEAGTVVQLAPISNEGETAILTETDDANGAANTSRSGRSTPHSLLDSGSSGELTRVGSVLGTPLYMSPEQCRGEHLDARSDVYSLGVIAYQMLSGKPPFVGDFKAVMEAHKNVEPKPLSARGVRRKMGRAIDDSLNKDPDKRPQTAEAFASVLRSRSEGIWALLRRSMVIYSEHLPKFLAITTFFFIPVIVLSVIQITAGFLRISGVVSEVLATSVFGIAVTLLSLVSAFCSTLTIGAIVWIVVQYLTIPLRPLRIRPALKEVRRNWKRIAGGGALAALTPMIAAGIMGIIVFVIIGGGLKLLSMATGWTLFPPAVGGAFGVVATAATFFIVYVWCMLITPVIVIERSKIINAFRRSRELGRRAFVTAMAAAAIMFFIPMVMASGLSFVVNVTAKAFDPQPKTTTEATTVGKTGEEDGTVIAVQKDDDDFNFSIGRRPEVRVPERPMDMRSRLKRTILESTVQIIWLPLQIIVLSFSGIIVALLYLKTRLAGGESMNDLIERFDDDGRPKKKWQERVRARLMQSGRTSSKP